jgi:hypothetical protein
MQKQRDCIDSLDQLSGTVPIDFRQHKIQFDSVLTQ